MAIEVEINQNDIEYSQEFIRQYLSDLMPTRDFSDGTGVHDLLTKAFSYIFAFLRSEISKVQVLRSLSLLADLEDTEEVQQAVNEIISNFFLTRGGGSKALVTITIVLSQKVDLFIGTENKFNKDDTHFFFPQDNYSIDKEDLIEVITTAGDTTYEYDITLEAENVGESYEVSKGTFISWDVFSPYILSVRNDQKGSGGDEIETSVDYIKRSDESITVRNLINSKSTRTVLLDLFKDQGLTDVTVIGYGDSEMHRDLISTNVTFDRIGTVHIGNHQDVYLNLPLIEEQTHTATTYIESYLGEPDRNGAIKLPQVPIYKIHSVKNALTGVDLPYTLFIRDYKLFFTKEQEAYIVLNSQQNGISVEVTYDTVNGFDIIHEYLRDPDERIVLANSLARAKVPIYVELNIKYSPIEGRPEFNSEAAIQTVLTYIQGIAGTESLDIDSLVKTLHASYGQDIFIKSPLLVKGTVFYPNGTQQVFYSENILTVPEYEALGVTNRVCAYVSSANYITFTQI